MHLISLFPFTTPWKVKVCIGPGQWIGDDFLNRPDKAGKWVVIFPKEQGRAGKWELIFPTGRAELAKVK